MTLKEIQANLRTLKDKGYIPSIRKGPTGIGHTLEQELNLTENNLSIPDIGGRVELKTTRRQSNSMVTLFTFNRAVWQLPQKEIIEKYGYSDGANRKSLYSSVFYQQPNPQNILLEIDKTDQKIHLYHNSGILLATWSIYNIVGKFISKLERLLVVFADNRINKEINREEFLFTDAYLLETPSPEQFIDAFEKSLIAINIRMHLKGSGSVRNHGTGFRIQEKDITDLCATRKKIL